MSANRKLEALHLFYQGLSLRKVAESVGVHRSTAERWSTQEHWREKRETAWRKAREELAQSTACTHKAHINEVYDSVHTLLIEAVAERQMYFNGKLGKRALRVSNRMFLNLAKAYAEIEASFIRNLGQRNGSG